jgi:hypothetical protein
MFRHHQEISPAGEVYSGQSLDLPIIEVPADPVMATAEAGWLYWEMLDQLPLIDVRVTDQGAVSIYVPSLLLLSFGPPSAVEDGPGVALRYPIQGGILVRKGGENRGYLQMGIAPGRVSLTVEGYYPALAMGTDRGVGPLIYKLTQSPVHVRIAKRYLPALARRFSAVEDNGLIRI